MKILLLDSYFGGSHKNWAQKLQEYSRHDIDIVSLQDRNWKWRMYGGALALFEKIERPQDYDLFLCTDMVDLSLFRSLNHKNAHKPHLLYFHENQFAYPVSQNGNKDELVNYQFINYRSALCADVIYFNSQFNYDSFFEGCERMLKLMPDHNLLDSLEDLKEKSIVLPVGIDFGSINSHYTKRNNTRPLILWNHRWDYDKGIEEFLNVLCEIKKEGYIFDLALLGKRHDRQIEQFNRQLSFLSDEILINENVEDYSQYIKWLYQSDIIPVTSNHDFFGISIIEAIYCNTHPLLPNRMVYPERIPEQCRNNYLYDGSLKEGLKELIASYDQPIHDALLESLTQFDWKNLVKEYDFYLGSFSE